MIRKTLAILLLCTTLHLLSACWDRCPEPKDIFYQWNKVSCYAVALDSSNGQFLSEPIFDSSAIGKIVGYHLNVSGTMISKAIEHTGLWGNAAYARQECRDNESFLNQVSGIEIFAAKLLSGNYPSGSKVNHLFCFMNNDFTGQQRLIPLDSFTQFRPEMNFYIRPQAGFDSTIQFTFKVLFSDNTSASVTPNAIRIR